MVVHTGRNSRDRVWCDHRLLSHGLATAGQVAPRRRTRLDQRPIGAGKTSEAEGPFLHCLAGPIPTRRHPADVVLFLCNDGRLWDCILAPYDSEASLRAE